jgi:hypothetical protein
VPVDTRRYPHFGGRKKPATCAGCERIVLCYVMDAPADDDTALCGSCLAEIVGISWVDRPSGPKGVTPGAPPAMWAYIDEDCPARAAGLSHTQDGPPTCVECGTRLLHRQRPA